MKEINLYLMPPLNKINSPPPPSNDETKVKTVVITSYFIVQNNRNMPLLRTKLA